jgi:hypothetical protein
MCHLVIVTSVFTSEKPSKEKSGRLRLAANTWFQGEEALSIINRRCPMAEFLLSRVIHSYKLLIILWTTKFNGFNRFDPFLSLNVERISLQFQVSGFKMRSLGDPGGFGWK